MKSINFVVLFALCIAFVNIYAVFGSTLRKANQENVLTANPNSNAEEDIFSHPSSDAIDMSDVSASSDDQETDEWTELKPILKRMYLPSPNDFQNGYLNYLHYANRDFQKAKKGFNPQTRWGKRNANARFNPQTRWG